jgi:hypothetical protein
MALKAPGIRRNPSLEADRADWTVFRRKVADSEGEIRSADHPT